jgi:hypothetical protein
VPDVGVEATVDPASAVDVVPDVDAVAADVSVAVEAVAVESDAVAVEAVSVVDAAVVVASVVAVVVEVGSVVVVLVVKVPVLSLTSASSQSLCPQPGFHSPRLAELGKRPGLFGSTSLGKGVERRDKPGGKENCDDSGWRPPDPDR